MWRCWVTRFRETEWSRQSGPDRLCSTGKGLIIPGACVLTSLYVNCFRRTVLYVCTEYCIEVNMYHVSAQCFGECMINAYYYLIIIICKLIFTSVIIIIIIIIIMIIKTK